MANFGDFLKGVVDYGSSRIAASNDLRDEEAKARMLARLQREEGRSTRVIQEGTRWFEVTINGNGEEVSRRELSQSEARERNRSEATADAQLTSTLIGSKSAERTLGLADEDRRREQEYRDAQLRIMQQNAATNAANSANRGGGGSMNLNQFTTAINRVLGSPTGHPQLRAEALRRYQEGEDAGSILADISTQVGGGGGLIQQMFNATQYFRN